jgi:endonuclease I
MTCYSGCAAPSKLPQVLLDWAIEVAANEPVTLWEKHRNAELFRLQGNRNPFIDFPHLAKKIDFSQGYIQKPNR